MDHNFGQRFPVPDPKVDPLPDDTKILENHFYGNVTCAACHGPWAEGNEALNAPRLRWLPDWYIVKQLQKFRAAVRGAARDDVPGNQMRAISQRLQSDNNIAAVASYIGTQFGH